MNKLNLQSILIIGSIILFTFLAIIAHLLAPAEYNWQENTISQLAAQTYNLAWIMQLGFFIFGILFPIGIILKVKNSNRVIISDILLFFYGLSILLSGIFSAKPFVVGTPYSFVESGLHYAFALASGMFLNFSIFFNLIFSNGIKEKLFHFVFLMTVFVSSMIVVFIKEVDLIAPLGVIQRITYLTGLIWLFIFFLKKDRMKLSNKLSK